MNGWLVFGLLAALYAGVWWYLRKREAERGAHGVSDALAGADPSAPFRTSHALAEAADTPSGFGRMGPLLVWRTQLGKRAIQQVAKLPRFWNAVADVGIIVTWILGILIFALLVLTLVQYVLEPQQSAENAPGLRELIGIPGINPLIPVGYGIAALVLALVIHEGSHGVMAYVSKMRVKSLGLVFFIIPVGAFVEPHEEDLMRSSTRAKNRVFAAGPTSNIVLALVAGILLSTLFAAHMHPVNDGEGLVVGGIEPTSAAELAGLEPGDVLVSLGGQTIRDRAQYTSIVTNMSAGDQVELVYLRDGDLRTTQAVLGDRYDHLKKVAPQFEGQEGGFNETAKGQAFLGIAGLNLEGDTTAANFGIDGIRDAFHHPFGSLSNFFFYLAYPFWIFTQGIDVMAAPYSELFTVTGPLAALPAPVFFGAAAFLYWVVWLNLMLGTFNALPAGPLDGGQMFRATLSERLMRRMGVDRSRVDVERAALGGLQLKGRDEETQSKLDRVNVQVGRATRTLGFFILGLIMLPIVGPPLVRLLLG